jgi:hypothetical protein
VYSEDQNMVRVLGVCRYNTAYGLSFSLPEEFCIVDWCVDSSSLGSTQGVRSLGYVYGFIVGCSFLEGS